MQNALVHEIEVGTAALSILTAALQVVPSKVKALPVPSMAAQKVGEPHDASTSVRSPSTTTGEDQVAVVTLKAEDVELIVHMAGATATQAVLAQETIVITSVGAVTLVQELPSYRDCAPEIEPSPPTATHRVAEEQDTSAQ